MSSQFQLLGERRFQPFFFTQFLGAFNDNVFKTALITLVTFRAGQLTDIDGKDVDLSQYKGKVVLLVNVASKCGYTPQYTGLQKLYETHGKDGLVIIGVPSL